MNASRRLELFDGAQWFPMEFPKADEDRYTVPVLQGIAEQYLRAGAAHSVRIQERSAEGVWVTVKLLTITIKIEEIG